MAARLLADEGHAVTLHAHDEGRAGPLAAHDLDHDFGGDTPKRRQDAPPKT